MASKRKTVHPSKLNEEKRFCLSWNLNEQVPAPLANESSQSSTICIGPVDSLKNGSRCAKRKRAKPKKHENDSNILLLIEKETSFETRCNKLQEFGPTLFQLLLTGRATTPLEETDEKLGIECCKTVGLNNVIESSPLFLRIHNLNENSMGAEEHSVEILRKGVSSDVDSSLSFMKKYFSVWTGLTIIPSDVIKSIKLLIDKNILKLSTSMERLEDNIMFLNARVVENLDGVFADEEMQSFRKTNARKSVELIMLYFYGILEEEEFVTAKEARNLCFTSDSIPALYDHIKKYHWQRFNIASADDATNPEKDDDVSNLSSESGSSSSSNQITDITSIKMTSSEDKNVIESIMDMDENDYKNERELQETEVDEIFLKPSSDLYNSETHIELLIPTLRQYQYAALRWMIAKENETEYELDPSKHVLWERLKSNVSNKTLYYNKFTGRISSKLLILPLPKGGILADEMGLGKTIEVLALISKNRRKDRFTLTQLPRALDVLSNAMKSEVEYESIEQIKNHDLQSDSHPADEFHNSSYCLFCGEYVPLNDKRKLCSDCGKPMHFDCAGTQGREMEIYYCAVCGTKEVLQTHCTLVISPETIVYQWIEEIQRHVKPGSLKYFLYHGVGKDGFIQPSILAEYDIILTTYSTLNAEFYHFKSEEGRARSLRNRKKYAALPSPLVFLEFWRVCLDEAQMIQCPTTKLAEMALRIRAVHRWCVTGTPVQRGLEDIYGMLLFIGVYPYCIKSWWNRLLCEPLRQGNAKPLFDVLSRVMWRTEKTDVLEQINLPKQTETLKWLQFTPLEWEFYKRQEDVCTENALKEINKWKEKETTLSSLNKSNLHSLLAPLLRLRQACCHPRAVRDGILGIQRSHLTMDKLLEGLKAKAKVECEEAHRQLMCAMNGLAAIDIIEFKLNDAVAKYRDAIQSWATHKEIFRTDLLQKLHTIKNLANTLNIATDCSRALSDDTLEREAADLANEYIQKSESNVKSAFEKLESIEVNLESSKREVDWKNPWWIQILGFYKSSNNEDGLIARIKEELRSQLSTTTFMQSRFKTIDGLQFLIVSKIATLSELRDKLKKCLVGLQNEPSKDMVMTTAACCLRPMERSSAPRCSFCLADDIFTEYENTIFAHRGMKRNGLVDGDDNKRFGGLRAKTELDVVLKTIHSMTRQNWFDDDCREQAKAHLSYMDFLKQEFKCLRSLWFALHKRISAYDELEMSVIQMRLRYENETATESYIIESHEVAFQRLKLQGDRAAALHHLSKKKGQLFYLKNLEKAQSSLLDSNPELCPICKDSLGKTWGVFTCGHCFCCRCATLLEQRPGNHFMRSGGIRLICPMCREPTVSEDVSYVVMKEQKEVKENDITVKGSYSVKIEAIVRKILEIERDDPNGKILVFSTWQDVLSIIAQALAENDVNFRFGAGCKQKFRACLTDFKLLPSVKVLLLPLKLGSKGLNIIEATHVILTEPTLNPANELQAIGRVHRIGQTKPTFVHRFIVQDTVEERIQELLKTKSETDWISNSDAAGSSLTIRDLSSLLLEKETKEAKDTANPSAVSAESVTSTEISNGSPTHQQQHQKQHQQQHQQQQQ